MSAGPGRCPALESSTGRAMRRTLPFLGCRPAPRSATVAVRRSSVPFTPLQPILASAGAPVGLDPSQQTPSRSAAALILRMTKALTPVAGMLRIAGMRSNQLGATNSKENRHTAMRIQNLLISLSDTIRCRLSFSGLEILGAGFSRVVMDDKLTVVSSKLHSTSARFFLSKFSKLACALPPVNPARSFATPQLFPDWIQRTAFSYYLRQQCFQI